MSWNGPVRQGLLGVPVPAAVKQVTTARLLELGASARDKGFSAVGRPHWTAEHRERIRSVILMPIGTQSGHDVLRCYAGVTVADLGLVVFTIDVEKAEFVALPDVADSWELARLLLYDAPHLPVDVEQDR